MVKRIIAIVSAVALAAVGTLVLVLYVRSAEDRALAGEETVEVLVLAEDVPRGADAEGLGDLVSTERVPVKVRAAGSVENLDDLEGKVTDAPLVAGEQVIASRFVDPSTLTAVEVPDGMIEVTVSVSPDRVIGGSLSPGDTVAVFSSFTDMSSEAVDTDEGEDDEAEGGNEATHLILHKVLVTNVQGERASQPSGGSPGGDDDEEGDDDEDVNSAPSGSLLVTLAVDAPSAERVVFTAEHGTIWFGLEPDDAPEDGTRPQTKESIYQ